MATTLYGTFPILLPGKTESISKNGLKKTTGTILFKPGQELEAQAMASVFGFVFPEARILTTDMGLLELGFDAYADIGSSSGVFGTDVTNLSKSFETTITQAVGNNPPAPIPYNWTVTEIWFTDSCTEYKTIAASLGSIFLQPAKVALQARMIKRLVSGSLPTNGTGTKSLTINWASSVASISRRNFGVFDEIDIVSSLTATIS
jgi:hypothetical protein